MAGLLDLYGGDTFTDQQKEALQQRGLLGFLGGLQKSGALDYVAPFQGMRWGSTAAGLAGGAAGMGEAQDAGALNAMRAQQLGLQAQELRGKLGLLNATPPPIYGGAPNTAGPNAVAPGGQPAPTGLLPALGQAIEAGEASGEKAVSPAGAIGIRQVLPSTAADYGVSKEDLFDVGKNRAVSDQYLGDMLKRYNGDVDAAIVAYNAGPKRADQFILAGKDPSVLPAETQRYLPKVKAALVSIGGGQGATPGLLASYQPGQAVTLGGPQGNPAPAAPRGLLDQLAQRQTFGQDSPVRIRMPGGQFAIPAENASAQPAPQGLLSQPAGNAPAAPGGGLLAQATSGQPPAPAPAPQPAAAGGMMPGGAMSPGGINPAYIQWAQQQANARSAFGVPVPGYMNEAGGLPFVGPQAAAKAEAENASKLRYAGPMAAAEAPYKMSSGRPGTIMWNGLGQPVGANPLMVESYNAEGSKSPAFITPPLPGSSPGAAGSPSVSGGFRDTSGSLVTGLGPGVVRGLETRATKEEDQRQKIIDDSNAALRDQATIKTMASESDNFTRGPFADHVQEAGRYLRLIDPSWNGQVASYENFVKNAGQLTRQAVRETSARAAVQEFQMIANTLPSPEMSPIGMRRVQNELLGLSDFRIAKAQAQRQWEGTHNSSVSGFETAFATQASPYSFIVARMDPQDRKGLIAKLQGTDEGRNELARLGQQMQVMKSAGLGQY